MHFRAVLDRRLLYVTMYPVSIILFFGLGLQSSCYGGSVKSNIVSFHPGGSETFRWATVSGANTVWYGKLQGYGIECASYVDHGFGSLIYFHGEIIGEVHVESCQMDQIARFITIQSYKKCHHHVEVCLTDGKCKTHNIALSGKCPNPERSLPTLRGKYDCINSWCQVERDDSRTLVRDVYRIPDEE